MKAFADEYAGNNKEKRDPETEEYNITMLQISIFSNTYARSFDPFKNMPVQN